MRIRRNKHLFIREDQRKELVRLSVRCVADVGENGRRTVPEEREDYKDRQNWASVLRLFNLGQSGNRTCT